MDEYKEHLRRLAVHDDDLLEAIAVEGGSNAASVIDERTAALVRVGATVAVDGAVASFQHAVALAVAAGATKRRDRCKPRGGDAGDGLRASRPVRPEGRAGAGLRRRRRARAA